MEVIKMIDKKESIKVRFLERINNDKPITYKLLKEEDSSLLYAIERHFGSISKLCAEIGISESEMISKYGFSRNINKRTLNESEIKERLLLLKSKGKLTTNAMRTEFDDLRLEQSIKKLYGSVQNGLDYFGLTRDSRRVTKDGIVEKIKLYSSQGIDMIYSNMVNVDSALVSNATKKFKKGWHELLLELNIPFDAKRKAYSKESIQSRLNSLYEEFGEMNYSLIKKHDSSILFYAHSNYKSIENFYLDMGFDPIECMDYDTQKIKGRQFELVFLEMLEAFNIEFKHNRHYNSDIRPDFQLDENIWIDCKLSSWTQTIKQTIEKYTPHCEKLIIVYLRGNKRKLYEYENYNVEFRKIDYYYPSLIKINRQDLINKFNNILNNTSESVTTERLMP